MIEGQFIVLEGIDGAGTTTHTKILAKALRGKGLPVHTTHEPSGGPIGLLLRQILTGRVVVPGVSGHRPPSWGTMALLFAADRLDHLEAEIVPNLLDGVTVVCDRYDHSSVAYQTLTAGEGPEVTEWVKSLNRQARRPDLTIVLDVSPEEAARRRFEREQGRGLYDDDTLQAQLADFYATIDAHFQNDRFAHVDANRSIEEVGADILRHVLSLRGE